VDTIGEVTGLSHLDIIRMAVNQGLPAVKKSLLPLADNGK